MDAMSSALIVIPTFNERGNIGYLIDDILGLEVDVDVLVIDDQSPDGTADVVREKQLQYGDSRLQLLTRSGKSGRGSACIEGIRIAREKGYDAAIEMDADLSHDPTYIPLLLWGLRDADVVIGSRYAPGGRTEGCTFVRRMLSRAANVFMRFVLGVPLRDHTNGFRCYGKHALLRIPELVITGYGFTVIPQLSFQLHREGFTFKEIPIVFRNRRFGASNMGLGEILESFTAVLKLRVQDFTSSTIPE